MHIKKGYLITVGFISFFIVFLLSTLTAIVIANSLQSLVLFETIFLLIGVLLTCCLGYWWFTKEFHEKNLQQELIATIDAISKSQAIIEFDMNGMVLNANDNFLNIMGYSLPEIIGKHHSLFVEPDYRNSQEYKEFWKKLNRGEYDSSEYKRIDKNGNVIWLLSSYNPIVDEKGKPKKVIKVASDITPRKKQDNELLQLTNGLQEIGQKIISDTNDISVSINQLEASSISQAASAVEQASSVTEISATIEEIKATAQQTLAKAKQLGESASITQAEGEKGREAINTMCNLMNVLQEKIQQISNTILSLNDKTQQISEITEVVADIAKQSKMLALNASIEAAKAGESGKGFAVVASEVKELAEKSRLSTERVQKILMDIRHTAERAVMVTEDGTKSVEENIHQVKLTGDIINSLGNVIEESSLASLQIVSAVREESVAIDQVDASIREINKVTHLFSSTTEQTKQTIIGINKAVQSLKDTSNLYQKNT